MKKRIFELFVCLLLVGTSFVVTLNTVRAPQDGDYIYTVSGGVATITGYNGTGGAITIPSTLGGYPTVAIGNSAFFSCSNLTSVTIPNSVITIGDCAFCNCTSLTSVTIPNNVTIIGDGAFGSCSSLTMINVDATNVNYASVDGVLYNKVITTLIQCPGGKIAVSIPNSVTTIEDYAFNSCTSLASVIIGNSVTTIGYCAFGSCINLTSVSIPNNVITIGDAAFAGCSSLISVTIANSVITIGNQAFYWCNSLTSVTIPNSVATIGNYAFDSCTSLASVTIGNGVTTIGYFAFISCFNLASITFLGLVAPITVGVHWIFLTPVEIRGHAYAASNFPPPGSVWNELTMGAYINQPPADIYVDDDNTAGPWDGTVEHPYQHIQDGVNAANEGNTVFVYSGIYYEQVTLDGSTNKNHVTLVGENRNATIIDACGYTFALNIVNSNNEFISKFFLVNASSFGCSFTADGIGCYDNKLSNCTIVDNLGDGLRLYGRDQNASNNRIINCDIYGNNGYGIRTETNNGGVSNNVIYHNNIFYNGHNAYDTESNLWYNATIMEGNYWLDYTGEDNNGDGIGDTPYNISGGSNQDLYPFMEQDGWLQPYSPRKTRMGILPSQSEILPGQIFNVTIYIDPTVGIGGWEIFTLSYTQEALNATLVFPGPFWTAFFDPGIINNGNGTITGIQSFTSGPYPDDNHTACVIQFTAVHPGRCHFNLSRVVVTDSAFNPLQVITSPATVIITSSPLVTNEYPINTAINIERPPTHLSAQVNVTESGSMDIFIRWKNHQGTWITLESFHMAGNNTYSYNPIGNDWIWGNTTYVWSVNVTDGVSWTNETYHFTSGGSRYDVNNNNVVNFQDAGLVWIHRTTLVSYNGLYDVNQDGNVNFQDAGLTWIHRD